jgi:hypothetical protein
VLLKTNFGEHILITNSEASFWESKLILRVSEQAGCRGQSQLQPAAPYMVLTQAPPLGTATVWI